MPRQARRLGNSGYYHVIMRGVDRHILFEDETDHRTFLSILKRCRREESVTLCAFCLMSNHLHLLLNCPAEHLARFIKKIGVHYSAYFNGKYDRVGHLFQDRFKSETIEDERYLLTVFRYILRNPTQAGFCDASVYPWSSYSLYGLKSELVDTSVFLSLLGDHSAFETFIRDDSEAGAPVMEYEAARLRDDAWAIQRAKDILQIDSPVHLQELPREERDHGVRLLRAGGLSGRQIARITGFSRGLIARICGK